MRDPFIMVVLIVLIITMGKIILARSGTRDGRRGHPEGSADDAEAVRLREEVKQLKERLAVLERITVEKENSLEREIERLRDR